LQNMQKEIIGCQIPNFNNIPSPVLGPRKGPLSHALRLVAYTNTATHWNPPLEYYELKDN